MYRSELKTPVLTSMKMDPVRKIVTTMCVFFLVINFIVTIKSGIYEIKRSIIFLFDYFHQGF